MTTENDAELATAIALSLRDDSSPDTESVGVTVKWQKECFKNVPLRVSAPDAVKRFKAEIQQRTGVLPSRQKLMAPKGRIVKDDSDLVGIKAGAVFMMMGSSAELPNGPDLRTALEGLQPVAGTFDLLERISINVMQAPAEPKYRRLKLSNKKIAASLFGVHGGLAVMESLGWKREGGEDLYDDEPSMVLPPGITPPEAQLSILRTARASAETAAAAVSREPPDGVEVPTWGRKTPCPDGHSGTVHPVVMNDSGLQVTVCFLDEFGVPQWYKPTSSRAINTARVYIPRTYHYRAYTNAAHL